MPANEAIFRHGYPIKSDHTPSGLIRGGQVVVLEELVCIAHRDIAAGEMGALAIGGGVYEVEARGACATGDAVYWDDTEKQVSTDPSHGEKFGFIVDDTSAANKGDKVHASHQPSPNSTV